MRNDLQQHDTYTYQSVQDNIPNSVFTVLTSEINREVQNLIVKNLLYEFKLGVKAVTAKKAAAVTDCKVCTVLNEVEVSDGTVLM